MGNKRRDFRSGPRKRGFDDDDNMFAPPPPRGGGGGDRGGRPPSRGFGGGSGFGPEMIPADAPTVDATVKWFNPEKGFGFAELSDGTGDAFLHIAAVQASGRESVPPGAKLKVHVGQGPKGRQITRVVEVDESTAAAPAPRGPRMGGAGGGFGGAGGGGMRRQAPDPSTAVDLDGAVKWFNGAKGFGFVAADDGGKDVFVHISVLERARLQDLPEGQRVSMKVVDTQKGREAISIALAG